MITPKPFQQIYIGNVLTLFRGAKSHFDEVTTDLERRRVFAYKGACLLKAPTGAGKTLIAGTVAEQFSKEERLVWLWFAPFKGLVGQAAMSLRDHHPGLRVRDLTTGRRAAGTQSGDTFVLTWASAVARSADARKPTLFPAAPAPEAGGKDGEVSGDREVSLGLDSKAKSQGLLESLTVKARSAAGAVADAGPAVGTHRYLLKPGMPLRFLTQELPFDILEHLLACIEQQVAFTDRTLLTALAKDVQIIRIEQTRFSAAVGEEKRSMIQARIDLEKAERQAQLLLMRQTYLSPKELLDHLLKRLANEFVSHGMSEVAQDEERLEAALSLILVRFPGLLKEVEKSCAARFSFTREAEPLPGFIESVDELQASYKNVYGVYPADLNEWELEFVKLLWKDWHDPKNRVAMTVAYDPVADKNVLDAVFRCAALPTY